MDHRVNRLYRRCDRHASKRNRVSISVLVLLALHLPFWIFSAEPSTAGKDLNHGCAPLLPQQGVLLVEATSDSDGDGLADDDEVSVYGTDPDKVDTDGDGLDDGFEVSHMPCSDPLATLADMNRDGSIDKTDFSLFAGAYTLKMPEADRNCSGVINSADLNLFKNAYLSQFLAGDINHDGMVDLRDAIITLKVCIGTLNASTLYSEADVNGDGQIWLEEMIYVLQAVSENR
jgi:hypothetical protein